MSNDSAADQARCSDARWLADHLSASRRDTLATSALYEQALGPTLPVPRECSLNPPLWELGHIGWFQEFWLARNPQWWRGVHAEPDAPRSPSLRPGGDALYDSSRVPHAARWSLPLPDLGATRQDLAAQLDQSLQSLHGLQSVGAGADDALYFFRLALLHEDMHHEAALYMARSLGIAIADERWQPPVLSGSRRPLPFEASHWPLGHPGPGFAFDNEVPVHEQPVAACNIDSRVLTWAEYLPFAEAGGYQDLQWWAGPGRSWLADSGQAAPRYLRRDGALWWQQQPGGWQRLEPARAAEHLTLHEAQAWCRWAGRRLPTEAQWERAACTAARDFTWGQVWEWTASPFEPFAGFTAHPYRDYSQPWFDGRPVLRGASYLTQPRLRHARYRNYFSADRNDIAAGFRSCALAA